jgi:histidine triad (HIT) family protein
MWMHEPRGYDCPFCAFLREQPNTYTNQDFVVYQDALSTAYVAPKWWPHTAGHVIVIPRIHTENIYTITDDQLAATYVTAKKIAIGMRTVYGCDGISMRQHNEPAGNQDVWHFHVHVFPRYTDDNLYGNHAKSYIAPSDERMKFADTLRAYFTENGV